MLSISSLFEVDLKLYTIEQQSPHHREIILKSHLANHLNCHAHDICIQRTSNGKPYLASPKLNLPHPILQFNMAYRENLIVIATSWEQLVGVDIEIIHPEDSFFLDVAKNFFNNSEIFWLESLPFDRRCIAFMQLWTAKEAVLKAVGKGIVNGLLQPNLTHCLTPGQKISHELIRIELGDELFQVQWIRIHQENALIAVARKMG